MWAEIWKSINSNLQVPLDKLITRVIKPQQSVLVQTTSVSGTYYTALNVTNALGGECSRISVQKFLDTNTVNIKITIDGGTPIIFTSNTTDIGVQAQSMGIVGVSSLYKTFEYLQRFNFKTSLLIEVNVNSTNAIGACVDFGLYQ